MLRLLRTVGAAWLCSLPLLALSPDRELTQYVHRIWQTPQGLPDGAINGMLQDAAGYLWLATEAGFVRFDGVRFTPAERLFPSTPPIRYIRAAIQDSSGTFWLGGEDGDVYSLNSSGYKKYQRPPSDPRPLIQCLFRGRLGRIWVCTEKGLMYFDPGTEPVTIKAYRPADGLHSDNIRSLCQDSAGALWIGGDTPRISILTGTSFRTLTLTGLPEATSVRALKCVGSTVWAATSFGLVRIENEKQQNIYTTREGLIDNFAAALELGQDGALWVGTRSGFSRLLNGRWSSFHPNDGLSQSTAFTILEDREGSLWVGTKGGLNQFVDGRSVPYSTAEGLPSNQTGPVIEDASGTVWVGTLDAGLARFDGRNFTTLTTAHGLPSNAVRVLLEDSRHSLWVGTDRGLARIEQGRVAARYGAAQGLPSPDIRSLFLGRDGTLWIGTAAGLASYANGSFKLDPRAPRAAIRCIGQDRDGNLLLGIDDGILLESQGKFIQLTQGEIYLRNPNMFLLDRDGLVWVALNGAGLRLINGTSITEWTTWHGIYDSEILGLVMDDQDRLWMACSRGVFWVDRNDLVRFSKGEVSRVRSVAYSPTEALRVVEGRPGVYPSLWRASNSHLWMSTTRGLLDLNPDAANLPAPPVVIEDPVVNGEPRSPAQLSSQPGGQKNIQFSFASLSYLQPEQIHYRYFLQGYNEDWIDAGNSREALYTNLPPGDYKFHVAACYSGNQCTGAGTSISFTLVPLFYQRSWFWALILLMSGALTWLAYQIHIRQLHARYDLILSERSRIARELHDTLIQGFSGITMALQAFSARIQGATERETLRDIIDDAATCLRETRQSVAGLRAVRDPEKHRESSLSSSIRGAVRELTETKSVRVKLNLDEVSSELAPEVEYNLLRIVREAVNNSVKHSRADEIEVRLRAGSGALNISVHDDGAGFNREDAVAPGPGHYGIIGMKERATQIGAILDVQTRLGEGTTISLILPLSVPADRAVEV